ncbi:MAG TPA: transcriptional regulator [Candidatus Nanoarchaeia archaeon]|nr:transcriptional regulator [Candidatus Nanoarchaeia archaeon]
MLPLLKQKLLFPQEIEVWYILPAIRKAFALELIKAGRPQKYIAQLMGITEAAISQYKSDKRAHIELTDEIHGLIKSSIAAITTPEQMFAEMMKIDRQIKDSGLFCKIHRSKSPTPDGCEKMCAYGANSGGAHG